MSTPKMGPGGPGRNMLKEKVRLKDAKGTFLRLLSYLEGNRLSLMVVLLLSLLSTVILITGVRLNGWVVDRYILAGDLRGLALVSLLLIAMFVLGAIMVYWQSRLMLQVSQDTVLKIRTDLFAAQQKLPMTYFDKHASGDLMSRLTNDIDNINMALSQNITQFFNGIFNFVVILVTMVLLSPALTGVSLVFIPVMFLLTFVVSKATRRIYLQQQSQLGALNGFVEESLSGQKATLLFGIEAQQLGTFHQLNQALRHSAALTFIGTGSLGPLMNLINNFTYLVVAVAGGRMVLYQQITPGTVFSFLLLMRNFARPLNELANLFTVLQGALAGAERVFEVLNETFEGDRAGAGYLGQVQGTVEMHQATFAYDPGQPIIKKADFLARPGTMTALVGPTGAGKTTLMSLLIRFYDLESGEIRLDGQPIEAFTRDSVRKKVGIVLQDTFLFSESVRDNIRYGRLEATDQEVEEAARLAHAHAFIERMPEGYETILSDNGENLSQGQRQLLSIARVILARPSILILDEATSSVDTRTEQLIQKALLGLMEGRTSFVIAHRLSTIKNADQILVLNQGEIVESGHHQELLTQKGFYAGMYNSQFRTGLLEA